MDEQRRKIEQQPDAQSPGPAQDGINKTKASRIRDDSRKTPAGGRARPRGGKAKKKRILWLTVVAVCIAVVVAGAAYLYGRQQEQSRQEQLLQMAAAQTPEPTPTPTATASAQPTPSPTPEPSPTPDVWPMPKTYKPNEREIYFEELLAENPDVIGWIEVPGTEIDYPLVANHGDDFYLDHDFYGEKSVFGAIFIDKRNENDFEQPHVILYGHNMKDGSMFAGLHRYEDRDFFDQNRTIKIYTPKGQLDYEIFAAYERDDAYIPGIYDMDDKKEHSEYLESVGSITDENAMIDMRDVPYDASILTLSTCVRGEDELRYVVQAAYVYL